MVLLFIHFKGDGEQAPATVEEKSEIHFVRQGERLVGNLVEIFDETYGSGPCIGQQFEQFATKLGRVLRETWSPASRAIARKDHR